MPRLNRHIIPALLLLLFAFPAAAEEKIISGAEWVLDDGRTVRLEGVHAPFDGALADQARAALEKLFADKNLVFEDYATDRYGRIDAQVYVAADGGPKVWLQGELLRAGMVFVYPPRGDEDRLNDMLKIEAEARAAKRGIWADDAYDDLAADKAGKKYGQFAFVSGTIVKAERIKNKVYLNFGADWKKDFTVTILAHDLHNFRNATIDPLTYEGKTIRVRGLINRDFGPMITVTHPAQITILRGP